MDRVKFKILRFDPETDNKPSYQTFEVPWEKGMTVLHGLIYIKERLDGTLAFRSCCRAGVCGSCAMHINGQYRLACENQIESLGKKIVIRPMSNMEILKDLVVDMEPFWNKFRLIKPYLIAGEPPPEGERPQSRDDRLRLDTIIDCILCGICTSSCTVTGTNEDYIGPAALLKAERFITDSRDTGTIERLNLVDGDNGVWLCHTIFNCQKYCPKDIDPTAGIKSLQKRLIYNRLKGDVSARQ
jgi:succinate dehydrogenase / fumarate reductase iron-sulfur subunit